MQHDGTYWGVEDLKRVCNDVTFERGKKPKTRDEWLAAAVSMGLVTPEDAAAPRKRQDVAAKMAARKTGREFTRSLTLMGLLGRCTQGRQKASDIRSDIDGIVDRLSRIREQRSSLVAAHLSWVLDTVDRVVLMAQDAKPLLGAEGDEEAEDAEGVEPTTDDDGEKDVVPDLYDSNGSYFRRCFTVGVKGATSKSLALQDRLHEWQGAFDGELTLPQLGHNVVTHAAKQYLQQWYGVS